ncbi:hypothetical protein [Microbacterium sp. ZW T5_56]|uniref:hypothetical protein n=1 Tax=Microbacterium sp. ZW T5_56 TaxID=3378081 RepID=UPI00385551A8
MSRPQPSPRFATRRLSEAIGPILALALVLCYGLVLIGVLVISFRTGVPGSIGTPEVWTWVTTVVNDSAAHASWSVPVLLTVIAGLSAIVPTMPASWGEDRSFASSTAGTVIAISSFLTAWSVLVMIIWFVGAVSERQHISGALIGVPITSAAGFVIAVAIGRLSFEALEDARGRMRDLVRAQYKLIPLPGSPDHTLRARARALRWLLALLPAVVCGGATVTLVAAVSVLLLGNRHLTPVHLVLALLVCSMPFLMTALSATRRAQRMWLSIAKSNHDGNPKDLPAIRLRTRVAHAAGWCGSFVLALSFLIGAGGYAQPGALLGVAGVLAAGCGAIVNLAHLLVPLAAEQETRKYRQLVRERERLGFISQHSEPDLESQSDGRPHASTA